VKRVLLAGAGHAHAVLLDSLAQEPLYGARITLVSPYRRQLYSAMVPGVIAGHYEREEAEFDVAAMAERAFAEFAPGSLVRLDAARRVALLADGRQIPYDIASLNVGSLTEDETPGAHEHALPLKPYERLVERLRYNAHIAIAGGGASGAELAMALRHRGAVVTLYSAQNPFTPALARRVERALRRRGVDYRPGMRADAEPRALPASAAVGAPAPAVCDSESCGAGSGAGVRSELNRRTPIQPSTRITTAPSTGVSQARRFGDCTMDGAGLAASGADGGAVICGVVGSGVVGLSGTIAAG